MGACSAWARLGGAARLGVHQLSALGCVERLGAGEQLCWGGGVEARGEDIHPAGARVRGQQSCRWLQPQEHPPCMPPQLLPLLVPLPLPPRPSAAQRCPAHLGAGSSRLILARPWLAWCSSCSWCRCGGALSTLGLLSMLCLALCAALRWLSRLRLSPPAAQKLLPAAAARAAACCCCSCCCWCRASSSSCCCTLVVYEVSQLCLEAGPRAARCGESKLVRGGAASKLARTARHAAHTSEVGARRGAHRRAHAAPGTRCMPSRQGAVVAPPAGHQRDAGIHTRTNTDAHTRAHTHAHTHTCVDA